MKEVLNKDLHKELHNLPKLTYEEKIFIVRVYIVMVVYWLPKENISYKGNALNMQ